MGLGGIYHHSFPPVEEVYTPDQKVGLSCGRDLEWEEESSQISLEVDDVGRPGKKLVLCHTYAESTKMPMAHSMEICRA